MEQFDPREVYPQLFDAFGKIQSVHSSILHEFVKRSEIIQLKRNEIIADGIQPSTHSYFIISGLIMCYFRHKRHNHVKWVRCANDYAYSMDMFRFRFGDDPMLTGDILVALEDTVVVRIGHEDINWLQDNSVEMGLVINTLMMAHTAADLCVKDSEGKKPLDKYMQMQQQVAFNLNRIPDIYLSSFLNINLVELKIVRESIQQ
jgi:hypothetical protein